MVIAPENLRTYYDGMRNITSMFVYDASFIKLRQVVIGYKLPAIKRLPAIREYLFHLLPEIYSFFTRRHLMLTRNQYLVQEMHKV